MYMTNEEIVKEYNEAKDKRGQIQILADMNSCKKDEIRAILAAEGVELPKRPYNRKKPAAIKTEGTIEPIKVTAGEIETEVETDPNMDFIPPIVTEVLERELKTLKEQIQRASQNIFVLEDIIKHNERKIDQIKQFIKEAGACNR